LVNSKATSAITKATQHAKQLILQARHHDPFSFLGLHSNPEVADSFVYRVFLPNASDISIKHGANWLKLDKTHRDGLFELSINEKLKTPCLLKVNAGEHSYEAYDAYSFGITDCP